MRTYVLRPDKSWYNRCLNILTAVFWKLDEAKVANYESNDNKNFLYSSVTETNLFCSEVNNGFIVQNADEWNWKFPDRIMYCPYFPSNPRFYVDLVVRLHLSRFTQKLCSCEKGVFTRTACAFSRGLLRIEAAVLETFTNDYTHKDVPDKTVLLE